MSKKGILLSGGMDSISIAFWKRPETAFTLNYGQLSAKAEIAAARAICSELGIDHHVIEVDCSAIGSGDLSGKESLSVAPKSDWWPYRNQMLVTLCGMAALPLGVTELMVGSVKSDSYHKDGSTEFYDLLNSLMKLQEGSLRVQAPAIQYTTVELIEISGIPKELLMWAHSCHKSNIPCNNCRGCNKYFNTLYELDNK